MSINYNVVVYSIILYCLITLSYFSMSCVAVLYYNKWYIPLRCSHFCTDKYCCIDNTILLCLVILFLHSNNVIMCHIILVCHNLILSRNILMFVFPNYNPVICLLLYYIVCNVDEIDTITTSRHQSSYCHIKRNTQHSISRSYYLYYSPPQHNSDPNTDTAPHPS